MDWKKINFDEVGYCLKSTKSSMDFSCLPSLTVQMEQIIAVFYFYGIRNFIEEDIRQMFANLQVISPRNDKVIMPTDKKVRAILEKMVEKGKLDMEDALFHIPDSYGENCVIFEKELERGKELGYLEGWIAYAKSNGDVCEFCNHKNG